MMPSEDQHHQVASSCSSLSNHAFTYSIQDREGSHQLNFYQEGGSGGNRDSDGGLRLSLWKKEDDDHDHEENQRDEVNGSVRWMSSKMRLMRRMMNSDRTVMEASINVHVNMYQKQVSSPIETDSSSPTYSYTNSPVRVCSDCNTTKTPLWRSGPKGPKSLCNACGIRQRKARRAATAAGAGGSDPVAATSLVKSKVQNKFKDKRLNMSSGHNNFGPYKKRTYNKASAKASTRSTTNMISGESSNNNKKKLCFEDFLVSLNKNLAFHRVFPQDEKEAAILLMALSCGLVHG